MGGGREESKLKLVVRNYRLSVAKLPDVGICKEDFESHLRSEIG